MIGLSPPTLDPLAARQLRRWTKELVDQPAFPGRVALAKKRFKSRNKKGSKTFDRVKDALYEMCNATHRCVYCEDNYADEVEHIRPKDVYPEQCFAWTNYVYACGPCNGPKGNTFAVFDATTGLEVDVTPPRRRPGQPPPVREPPPPGSPLFIDPRVEDPLRFITLDFTTGALVPHPTASVTGQRRGAYTIDLLGLNGGRRPKARRLALETFIARLEQFARRRDDGATPAQLRELQDGLLSINHQTVFQEMRRWRHAEPAFKAVFDRVPEALAW